MWQRMKKTEAYRYDDGLFHVTEIFDSIDGEGKRTGLMAIFVRLAGCNLRCSYCYQGCKTHRKMSLETAKAAGDMLLAADGRRASFPHPCLPVEEDHADGR